MMQRNGQLNALRALKKNPLGHIIMLAGAVAMGYGFSINGQMFLIGGGICLWIADELLTKTIPITPNYNKMRNGEASQQNSAAEAALLNTIEEKRKTDPLVGAKIGGKEVFHRLFHGMKNEQGVHIESLLCALGALSGYSCQASLRAQAVEEELPETAHLIEIATNDGKKYFFGDPLNQALAESEHSIWNLAGGVAQLNGCKKLPDINSIFEHVARTIGDESFGKPRLPEGHNASDSPLNFLKTLWPIFHPVAKQFCTAPNEWPIMFGLAIQIAIHQSKEILAPDLAVLIVMESAVPMSKIDLATA